MALLCCVLLLACTALAARPERQEDTGFLNRKVVSRGVTYRYMVYVPQDYDPKKKWPVILFLHGLGERGADGETETNIGLPAAIRNHPERWPFLVVMPQVPYNHHYWPDPDMMAMAMAALDATEREFHGDPEHTYLAGISLGGFGTWEIAKTYPNRFAAIVPVCGGIRWDWVAGGRHQDPNLPQQYVNAIGHTPVWMFHGADDPVVSPAQSEEMYEAFKNSGGHVRFWLYERVGHPSWDRAFAEPELPRWLLNHSLEEVPKQPAYAERRVVPIHPVPAHVDPGQYDAYAGEYGQNGSVKFWITRDADRLLMHQRSTVNILLPESANTFFLESGGTVRIFFQKDATGKVTALTYRDDRHEETFQRMR